MYIKKLSANKDSFHDLTFKNGKLNIILGSKGTESSKKNNTVNGVGKTLSIKLINVLKTNMYVLISSQYPLAIWDFNTLKSLGIFLIAVDNEVMLAEISFGPYTW